MTHADILFSETTEQGIETCRWDRELNGNSVRLGIRRGRNGDDEYVIVLDEPEGSKLVSLGAAAGDAISNDVRQRACAWLANADPKESRRAYWAARSRCQREISVAEFYDQVAEMRIVFGPSFRCVREIWRGKDEAIGRIDLSESLISEVGGYIHHPVFLDSCLQLFGATLYGESSRKTFLPVGMEVFHFEPGPVSAAWSHVMLRRPVALEDKTALADFVFYDLDFRPVGEIIGFSLKLGDRTKLLEQAANTRNSKCCRIGWEPLDASSDTPAIKGPIMVLGGGERAARIRRHLQDKLALPDEAEDISPIKATGAVIALDDTDDVLTTPCSLADADSLLDMVTSLGLNNPDSRLTKLWFVTRSTQQVTGHDDVRPRRAFDWGFARSLEREYPQLQVCCIDEDGDNACALTVAEIACGSAETMVAYRGGVRYVARISALDLESDNNAPTGTPFILKTKACGSLDNLYLAPLTPLELQENEVEIRVHATGLNFKDVLHALGMLTLDGQQSGVKHSDDMLFGGDCAGVVTRTGAAVTSVRPGDRVMAIMAFGSFASHVKVCESYVAKLPDAMPFPEAAAIPTAYLTAFHALVTCGELKAGDHVLIHAAAGGVGLAATQIALHFGAVVYATASRSKHSFLRSIGVMHVYDSRNPGFAEQLTANLPQHVDMVLNSLNGEFISRSFSVLRKGGRFVEIGKIGVWSLAEVAERRPDVRYTLFDLMDVARDQPTVIADEFKSVLELMTSNQLRPYRIQTFPISRVAHAFRCMAEARHIGKIVVTQPEENGATTIRSDRCHIVVGGLGAIGRGMIDWLASQGARHIVAIGRRAPDESAQRNADVLHAQGIDVRFLCADMSDRQQAEEAFKKISEDGIRIGGIFHLAGVLSDAMIQNQSQESFAKVARSKIDVAINLHLASLHTPHDHFVCFSSIASVFGSAGQSNYAAANAVVDALVHYRRSLGLSGLSVNWGPWADAGMADAMDATDKIRLAEAGVTPLAKAEAFALLKHLLVAEQSQAIVLDADWSRTSAYPAGRVPPCVVALAGGPGTTGNAIGNIVEILRGQSKEECLSTLVGAIMLSLSQVLRLSSTDISPNHTMGDLGLDSLMGMELRHKLEQLMGIPIPVSILLKGPSVISLATDLLELAGLASPPSASPPPAATTENSRWLVRIGGQNPTAPRLICFHHLGGNSDFFRRWAEPLFNVAEVYAVQLPGRGQRVDEDPVLDVNILFDALMPVLEPLLDRPFMLYGHSMGSHLAFECARRARARGYRAHHVFASGLWSPIDHAQEKHAPHLVENGLIDLDIPSALRDDNVYMHMLMSLVRADTALLQSYAGIDPDTPIDIPITAFSGRDDRIALPVKVSRWESCTSSSFHHMTMPGKHMFVDQWAKIIHDQIRSALSTLPTMSNDVESPCSLQLES